MLIGGTSYSRPSGSMFPGVHQREPRFHERNSSALPRDPVKPAPVFDTSFVLTPPMEPSRVAKLRRAERAFAAYERQCARAARTIVSTFFILKVSRMSLHNPATCVRLRGPQAAPRLAPTFRLRLEKRARSTKEEKGF